MMRNFPLVAAMAIGTLLPSATNAATLTSTYTETRSCPVTHEGVDEFIRECRGPGDVRAVLQYVDGLFGIFYLPMGGSAPMERSDMLEVSGNAPYPYGTKHEWRLRKGVSKPCAAIIRAYTPTGEYLVVTELEGGTRLGRVRTNNEARTLADKACLSLGSAATTAAAPTLEATTAATAFSMPGAGDQTIQQAASNGMETFARIYAETGISGAIEGIKDCYRDLEREPTVVGLAQCAALDILAANVDTSMSGAYQLPSQPFLSGTKPDERIEAGMNWLDLSMEERDRFNSEIAVPLGVTLTDAPRTPALDAANKSVFDFAK